MTAPAKTLFFVAHVATRVTSRRGSSLCWSKGYDEISEARAHAKTLVRSGEASMAVVVRFEGGEKTPLSLEVYPEAARTVVRHWEEIWDATEPEGKS